MNRDPLTIDPKIFDKVEELVGSEETAEDLWNIFDELMVGYDDDYLEYSVDQVGYLFLIFVFGYSYGVDDMPRIQFTNDTSNLH